MHPQFLLLEAGVRFVHGWVSFNNRVGISILAEIADNRVVELLGTSLWTMLRQLRARIYDCHCCRDCAP
jgi:hypothetical protein